MLLLCCLYAFLPIFLYSIYPSVLTDYLSLVCICIQHCQMIFSCHADGQQHLYIEHNSCCCCPYSVIMLARCYHDVATTTYFRHIGATSLCDISQLSGSHACRLYTQCDRSAGRPASPRKGARQRLPELAGKRPETSRPKRQGLARPLAGEGCR